MLARLHVENFRCLRDVTVDFGALTVLIGPNDSGKTSVLDAIRTIGRTFSEPLTEVFSGPNSAETLSFGRKGGAISWELTLCDAAGKTAGYRLKFPPLEERDTFHGSDWSRGASYKEPTHVRYILNESLWGDDPDDYGPLLGADSDVRPYVADLLHLPRYRFDPDALRRPCASEVDAVLSSSGDNLTAVLDRLISGPDRTRIAELERDLNAAIPTLRGVSLRTIGGGKKTIEFVLAGTGARAVTIPCENASDGALLLTAYLALAYSEAPGILLIEEPENGLHPSRLGMVVESLRKIAKGEFGRAPRQVIIATQSPLLLNFATKDEVRIVRRSLAEGTSVTPMAAVPDIDALLKEFAVGELWLHLGEDALVAGVKP